MGAEIQWTTRNDERALPSFARYSLGVMGSSGEIGDDDGGYVRRRGAAKSVWVSLRVWSWNPHEHKASQRAKRARTRDRNDDEPTKRTTEISTDTNACVYRFIEIAYLPSTFYNLFPYFSAYSANPSSWTHLDFISSSFYDPKMAKLFLASPFHGLLTKSMDVLLQLVWDTSNLWLYDL